MRRNITYNGAARIFLHKFPTYTRERGKLKCGGANLSVGDYGRKLHRRLLMHTDRMEDEVYRECLVGSETGA